MEGRERKNHNLSIIESKCYDLEFLSTLFHIFNNLILGLFYFGSLAGYMKSPRGRHAARGRQVGKPWCTITLTILREWLGRCEKLFTEEEGMEGGEKKARPARPGAEAQTRDLPRARRESVAARHGSCLDK